MAAILRRTAIITLCGLTLLAVSRLPQLVSTRSVELGC
jgi:hypothetical protein